MTADPELRYLGAVEAVNGFREGSGAEVNLLDRNVDVRCLTTLRTPHGRLTPHANAARVRQR